MSHTQFRTVLQSELDRVDDLKVAKRHERVIEGFTNEASSKALISGKEYRIFNSNDYLGLRLDQRLKDAEHTASETFGAGPGAVRFISGSLAIHREL